MIDHVIDFNSDGTVDTLYSSTVDMRSLGKVSMNRASNVLFDVDSQMWRVIPYGYPRKHLPSVYSNFDTYESAVYFEVQVLNKARELGLLELLLTTEGVAMAVSMHDNIEHYKNSEAPDLED